jgi:hypothetical protein
LCFVSFVTSFDPWLTARAPTAPGHGRKSEVFHTQPSRPVVAPGLLHNREFRRALLFGGAISGVLWLATAWAASRVLLNLWPPA